MAEVGPWLQDGGGAKAWLEEACEKIERIPV